MAFPLLLHSHRLLRPPLILMQHNMPFFRTHLNIPNTFFTRRHWWVGGWWVLEFFVASAFRLGSNFSIDKNYLDNQNVLQSSSPSMSICPCRLKRVSSAEFPNCHRLTLCVQAVADNRGRNLIKLIYLYKSWGPRSCSCFKLLPSSVFKCFAPLLGEGGGEEEGGSFWNTFKYSLFNWKIPCTAFHHQQRRRGRRRLDNLFNKVPESI